MARTFVSDTTSRMPASCITFRARYSVVCGASVSCWIRFAVIGPLCFRSDIILSFNGFLTHSWMSANSIAMGRGSAVWYMNVSKMETLPSK